MKQIETLESKQQELEEFIATLERKQTELDDATLESVAPDAESIAESNDESNDELAETSAAT